MKTSFKNSFVNCIDKLYIMKKLLFLLIVPMVSFGQMDYYVSAKGGLNVREAPKTSTKESYVKAMISLD